MPKLIMMSAPSGSGKSTIAREMMKLNGNLVRLNRDEIRLMSIEGWRGSKEAWILEAEKAMCRAAASLKKDIIVDDTNLLPQHEAIWSAMAKQIGYEFEKKTLNVSLQECVERDRRRSGSKEWGRACIGRPAIERQFLRAKLWKVPAGKKVVIFDIDGTLADLQHRVDWIQKGGRCPQCTPPFPPYDPRYHFPQMIKSNDPGCPYCKGTNKLDRKWHDVFYRLAGADTVIEIVANWLRACYNSGEYYIIIVSGRAPETCWKETVDWLSENDIPYEHLFMRRPFMHGPDTEEKQLILNDLLTVMSKDDIAFVVDDRPSVVRMWRQNGLKVYPVRGRQDDAFYELDIQEIKNESNAGPSQNSTANTGEGGL